eukprot:CAMPEP_0197288576 /NCGR_PEP_ID=MMETSP0890-20130614/5710_1 /TAXON_ID=44058 ORGANISM="Aureoumbra lagunensis, Strain CCMP1510" /NCGR_SAMPLE_ID=MMETSP0890 /ASSEMBLY_ACC=CAM_ASM_000533 /LENGTH=382 /DNA_ID=CAMNT_0042759415 /DNA_START=234 /DNA_END=1382 /DNA_ORIENTATION=+
MISKCWTERQDPRLFPARLRLDSYEDAVRELSALEGREGNILVADVTTKAEGRDIRLLQRVAEQVRKRNIFLTYGASILQNTNDNEEAMAVQLKQQLIDTRQYVPPTFISIRLSSNFVTEDNKKILNAARIASQEVVLVYVSLPAFKTLQELRLAAALVRETLGSETPKLIRSASRCLNIVNTLLGYDGSQKNTFAIVDGFGRPLESAVWYFADTDDAADEPNDLKRIAELSTYLREKSLALKNILISDGIRHKFQLRAYGGFGYGYAINILQHHLLVSLRPGTETDDEDDALYISHLAANHKILRVLSNSIIPAPEEQPIPKVYCSFCNSPFPIALSDRYAKFDFVYCCRNCLDEHRQSKFAESALRGPPASAQLTLLSLT